MKNYLEKLCINLGIKLIYVNNKVLLLSCDIKNSMPIIRVHKIFKSCTEEVAVAILGYYTDSAREQEYEKIIRLYIEGNYIVDSYKIKTPKELFKSFIIDMMPLKDNIKAKSDYLVEFQISSMILIDESGLEKEVKPNDSLRPLEDDILEMDIVVSQPYT